MLNSMQSSLSEIIHLNKSKTFPMNIQINTIIQPVPNQQNLKDVSIIIPAYNEEKRIIRTLDEISDFIKRENLNWEVIVAVDGNDRTIDIVNSYENSYYTIKANHSVNREGMGGAIKRGILASSGDLIFLMDADGSATLTNLIRSISSLELESYDIINFDRYSTKENFIPFKRWFSSRIFNIILRGIFRIEVNDTQCGYKIIRRDKIEPFLRDITVSDAFFLSALFIYSKKIKLRTIEIPIKYHHTKGSKFNVLMTGLSYIITITAFKLKNSEFFEYVPKSFKDIYYQKLKYL